MPQVVDITQGPASGGEAQWVHIVEYSGVNRIYEGWARKNQAAAHSLPTISSASKAATCALTITAHKVPVGARIPITISGVTGTGWTALNTSLVATYYDANTLTVPVDSQGFGTLGGTAVVTTTYPTTSQAVWAILGVVWVSNLNVLDGWADGVGAATKIWDSRASYSY